MYVHLQGGGHCLAAAPQLDVKMLFGFLACSFNIVCLIERRRTWAFVATFVVTCAAVAGYAIQAGAWPLAMVETAMTVIGFQCYRPRWDKRPRERRSAKVTESGTWAAQQRTGRLFGEAPSIWN